MVTDTPIGTQPRTLVQTDSEPDHEASQETRQRLTHWANLQMGRFTQVPDRVRRDPTLTSNAKQVYETLLSYMWDKDYCFVSQETIAQELGISRRTVIRCCNELYQRGLIDKYRRGLGLTNYWFVNPLSFAYSTGLEVTQISLQRPEDAPLSEGSELAALYGLTFYANDPVFSVKPEVTNLHHESDSLASTQAPKSHSMHTKFEHTEDVNIYSIISSDHKEEVFGGIQPNAGTGTQNQDRRTELEPEKRAVETRPKAQPSHQDGATAAAISQATGIPADQLETLGISPQARRRPTPDFIAGIVGDFTDALGDKAASRKGNITRATKYYYLMWDYADEDFRYDPQGYFERLLYIARAEALECNNIQYRNGNTFNRMPAFFGCLEKRLGLSEEERQYVRTDGPLYYPETR